MPISIRDDYLPGTRYGNTCTCCKAGRRDLRDTRTGKLRKELVVDLGDTVDFEGFVMICESCVREAAGLLGMVEPFERDDAVAAMHELQAAADEAKSERDEAFQLVDLLRSHEQRVTSGFLTVDEPPAVPVTSTVTTTTRRPRAAKNV